jgi:NET1-associated nuclear protein 1 (U3 small nucleolar RNA-associated protein 17)
MRKLVLRLPRPFKEIRCPPEVPSPEVSPAVSGSSDPAVKIIRTFGGEVSTCEEQHPAQHLPSHNSSLFCVLVLAMAEVNGMPKLKRKRNGADPQRKKVKTENEGFKAVATQIEDGNAETNTPLKAPTVSSSSSKADAKPTPAPPSISGPTPTPQKPHSNGTDPTASTTSKTRKDKKRDREQKKAELQGHAGIEAAVVQTDSAVEAVKNDNVDHPSKKDKKQKKHKEKLSDQWSLSGPQGGWFLPQDPVFSPDEKYLLLAKPKTLEVYATETSLLVQELPVAGSVVILSYCISSVQPNQVYIADTAGIITLWNWTNGSKVGRWHIGASVRHLDVVKQPCADQDLLYAHEAGSSHVINVHALRTGAQASKTELKRILKTSKPITGIQVLLQGKIVVASSAKSILIGKRTKLHKTAVQDFEYIWREFETPNHLTTFNAYVRLPDADKSKKSQPDPRDHLDLAIGDGEGVIHLFEDILSSLATIEKSQKNKGGKILGPESLRPKRLHWHREAVGSIKWSLDGV